MSATWMNSGLLEVLHVITGQEASARPGTLHLYVNNHTPDPADTVAAYTECTLSGYAPAPYNVMSWSDSGGSGVEVTSAAPLIFTFPPYGGSPVTIYGLYITFGAAGTPLYYAELFATPFVVNTAGDTLTLYPSISGQTLP